MNKPKQLPMESNDDYQQFLRQYEQYRRGNQYLIDMMEEAEKYEHTKFLVVLEKQEVWLFRAVAVGLVVLVAAQIIIFITN